MRVTSPDFMDRSSLARIAKGDVGALQAWVDDLAAKISQPHDADAAQDERAEPRSSRKP